MEGAQQDLVGASRLCIVETRMQMRTTLDRPNCEETTTAAVRAESTMFQASVLS